MRNSFDQDLDLKLSTTADVDTPKQSLIRSAGLPDLTDKNNQDEEKEKKVAYNKHTWQHCPYAQNNYIGLRLEVADCKSANTESIV